MFFWAFYSWAGTGRPCHLYQTAQSTTCSYRKRDLYLSLLMHFSDRTFSARLTLIYPEESDSRFEDSN